MAEHEISRKQAELYRIADAFERLRRFFVELRRVTKGKPFHVANDLAWDSALALQRTLVIDLAAWVRTLHGSRKHRGWLRAHLSSNSLSMLRTSRKLAAKLADRSHVSAPPEVEGFLRASLARDVLEYRRTALRRLFGTTVAARGQAVGKDVERLERRLFAWAEDLHEARNATAHPYGKRKGTPWFLPLRSLDARVKRCGRIMNDLRLLVLDETASMPMRSDGQRPDPHSADLVDLIVLGTSEYARGVIEAMPGQWFGEKREAYYSALHARRRRTKSAPFNEPL
jgi:hypothetical protein